MTKSRPRAVCQFEGNDQDMAERLSDWDLACVRTQVEVEDKGRTLAILGWGEIKRALNVRMHVTERLDSGS